MSRRIDDESAPSSRAPVTLELTVRRHRFWLLAVQAIATIGLVFALLHYGGPAPSLLNAVYDFVLLAALNIGSWRTMGPLKNKTKMRVAVDSRGVVADGKKLIDTSEMASAAYLRPSEKTDLMVYFPARQFWKSFGLDVADTATANDLLARLGQDPAAAAARFRLVAGFENRTLRTIATFALATLFYGGNIGQAHGYFGGTFTVIRILAALVAGLSFLLPTYVTVGADGILIERRGRRRFVAFSQLEAIKEHAEYKDAVVLVLSDGETITLRTSTQDRKDNKAMASDETRALFTRLDGAFAAFKSRDAGETDVLAALGRTGKTASDWIASLAKASAASGYRMAPITNEQLWAVLEDPAARSDDRAAALIALRAALDEKGKVRVRKTIDACAEPHLRVALDAAIGEDESDLEAALDALEAEKSA